VVAIIDWPLTFQLRRFVTQRPREARLSAKLDGRLDLWSPDSPALYGLVLEVSEDGKPVDRRYVRFGWRQFGIEGTHLMLNGKTIQAKGDACHFMGIPQLSRRDAWSWCMVLKDANANAFRLHAQPYPSFYLDVADEMGLMVLDESAVYASACDINYDLAETWERFRQNILGLYYRDRNHPSVFGWSVDNEINGALSAKQASADYIKTIDDKIVKIATELKDLDPTRPWISADGDRDSGGGLPVIIGHYENRDFCKSMALSAGKPVGVGEAGMAYYGTPKQIAIFNGDRAYESQEGRMEGLAYEAYDLIVNSQKPWAAYCAVYNLAWHGLKPLPIGLDDVTHVPELEDGIIFGDYVEGKPGVQPERLGPYCTMFNPGYDPKLPLYEPWPLFDAVKAAYANSPVDSKWAHMPKLPAPRVAFDGRIESIVFIGDKKGPLYAKLDMLEVQVSEGEFHGESKLMIIDGSWVTPERLSDIRQQVDNMIQRGGTVLIWGVSKGSLSAINELLPEPVHLTSRQSVSLVKHGTDASTRLLTLGDMYFGDASLGAVILEAGLSGPFVEKGKMLLEACNTDWRRWNSPPVNIRDASVLRSEAETKSSGAALVEMTAGKGRILICNTQSTANTSMHVAFARKLLGGLDVKFHEGKDNELRLILGKELKGYGLELRVKDPESENYPVVMGGREAWTGKKIGEASMMYFIVSAPEFQKESAPEVNIEVEYFDETAGEVNILYDSSDKSVKVEPAVPGAWKSAGLFQLAGSGEWKTLNVSIKDARFSGECHGADFRLDFFGGARPFIGSVRVRNITGTNGGTDNNPTENLMENRVFSASGMLNKALIIGEVPDSLLDKNPQTGSQDTQTFDAPKSGDKVGPHTWTGQRADGNGEFTIPQSGHPVPSDNSSAYVSFWIYSPKPLDELLAQPNVPHVNGVFTSNDSMTIWLNDKKLTQNYEGQPQNDVPKGLVSLPFKKGWNHFLVKIAHGSGETRFSVKFTSSYPQFQSELESSAEPPSSN